MPEDTDILAQYSFVPWVRRGIATEIEQTDTLGTGDGSLVHRATMNVELTLQYNPAGAMTPAPDRPTISRDVSLIGPGDVKGIKGEAVIRTYPIEGTRDFVSNALPYIEFYEEDFPWRFTPARAAKSGEPEDKRHKLRPWAALWILRADEFEMLKTAGDQPAALKLIADKANKALPLHTEAWAWAHVQIAANVNSVDAVPDTIENRPNNALSRLVCPRKLEPETDYFGFLVPTFETGRLAGLGEDPSSVKAQAPSWKAGDMPHSNMRPLEYPIYHQFNFRTGEGGDFETLVRKLKGGPVGPEFGKREVDISTPGFGMDDAPGPDTVQVEGALRPPSFNPQKFPQVTGTGFTDKLEEILDLSHKLENGVQPGLTNPFAVPGGEGYATDVPDDPIITPPAYARTHAAVQQLADARSQNRLKWLRELNLDPRARMAAGLGTKVVQDKQDELVERSWQQVGELQKANQKLREAEFALAVSEAVYGKHFARSDDERGLRLTAPAQRRILHGGKTIRSETKKSRVPLAAQEPAFKRVTRPQRKLIRQLTGSGSVQGFHSGLIGRMNEENTTALSAAPLRALSRSMINMSSVLTAVASSVTAFETEGRRARHVFLELLLAEFQQGGETHNPSIVALKASMNVRVNNDPDTPGNPTRADEVRVLIDLIESWSRPSAGKIDIIIPAEEFNTHFGATIDGKTYRGVTVKRTGAGDKEIARMTDAQALAEYNTSLQNFSGELTGRDPNKIAPAIDPIPNLARTALQAMRPKQSLVNRVARVLPGISPRPSEEPRRLRPVMAHPSFSDPMFKELSDMSQDWIIPNYTDLPENTITLLEPNSRFIESYLAGMNHEMSRELLWREFPTDMRGTYFQKFWDTSDDLNGEATSDIKKLHRWSGKLGDQSGQTSGYLVLVIRGDLLRRYPDTVVYARKAAFPTKEGGGLDHQGERILSEDTPENTKYPAFQGVLAPDIAIFGFRFEGGDPEEVARGNRAQRRAGWFFALEERPGQVRFGLDDPSDESPGVPAGWEDLHWGHLNYPTDTPHHVSLTDNSANLSAVVDADNGGDWGRSSADMASILLQDPVLYARHAEELLP